jgi:predicted dehydrogenase
MGPYYLTALVHMLGPVRRVVGMSSRPRSQRTIGEGPRAGRSFPVDIDSHVTGILEHDGGALTTMMMSFDIWATRLPFIEIYGSTGSLSVPDPNHFAGDVQLYARETAEWTVLTPSAGYADAGRGVGILDLYEALAVDRPHRAGVDVALHVLDVMESMQASARSGSSVTVSTTCRRPERVDRLINVAGGA